MTDYYFGSLFSGIGGIDLGLERAGFKVKWQSEIDPYSSRVLKKHWANIPNLGDIKEIKWDEVERVDVIAGGYPCQPFSLAGHRRGQKDERHLWDYYCTAISVLRPRVAFLENVFGHHSMGFDRVLGDLTEIGYDAEWQIVSAQSVGAPHIRERLICLSYPNDKRCGEQRTNIDGSQSQSELFKCSQDVPNNVCDWDGIKWSSDDVGQTRSGWHDNAKRETADVSRQWWAVEPSVGRVVDGVPSRVDRLRGLGNAVVPQVAEYVGWIIRDLLEEQTNG